MLHKQFLGRDSLQLYEHTDFSRVCNDPQCKFEDCCRLRILCRAYLNVPVIAPPFCKLKKAILLRLEDDILRAIMTNPRFSVVEIGQHLSKKWKPFNVQTIIARMLDNQLIRIKRPRGLQIMKRNVRYVRKVKNQSVLF